MSSSENFVAEFLDKAWTEHADDPSGVADRLNSVIPLLRDDGQLADLARLAQHVFGEHLGRWSEGVAFLDALRRHSVLRPGESAELLIQRLRASLALAAGDPISCKSLEPSDAICATAMAAASLAERDSERAGRLFFSALNDASSGDFGQAHSVWRVLAVVGNNIACAMEQIAQRSEAQRELMLAAATAGRTYWEKAGTWLEVERAEYRLAMSWLAAGDPSRAQVHAQKCITIVESHGGSALERFFGFEALTHANMAAANATAAKESLVLMERELDAISEPSDRLWAVGALEALKGKADTQ